MRLDELDLLAFGPFTDEQLDLSSPGIHVIYGQNGAGKTTAMRALRGLLFGISARTPDGWFHDMSQMRVGAVISNGAEEKLEFIRFKRQKDALTDREGAPIELEVLLPFLGQMPEAEFTSTFIISQEELSTGAEEMLKQGGESGTTLVSASLGSGTIQRLLDELTTEAEELFKPRGAKQSINADVKIYEEITKLAREASVSSSAFKTQEKQLTSAETERKALTENLKTLEAKVKKAKRLEGVLGPLAERTQTKATLESLSDVPQLDDEAAGKRELAQQSQDGAEIAMEATSSELDKLNMDLLELGSSPALLSHTQEIGELHILTGEIGKARLDLPKLQDQVGRERAAATALLEQVDAELTIEAAASRRINVALEASLEDLFETKSVLDTEGKQADIEVSKTKAEIASQETERDALALGQSADDLSVAIDDCSGARAIEQEQPAIREEDERLGRQLDGMLSDLPLVSLPMDAAVALDVPLPETISEASARVLKHEQKLEGLDSEAERLSGKLRTNRADLKELERVGAVPTDDELNTARQHRADGWQAVRAAWLDDDQTLGEAFGTPLAETYEEAVTAADRAADQLRSAAAQVEKKAALLAEGKTLQLELAEVEKRRVELEAQITQREEHWRALWKPLGIDPLSPPEMLGWVQRHSDLKETQRAHAGCVADLAKSESALAAAREAVSNALVATQEDPIGVDETLANALSRSEKIRNQINENKRDSKRIDEAIKRLGLALKRDTDALNANAEAMTRWKAHWDKALAELQMPNGSSVGQVKAVMKHLKDAFAAIDEAEKTAKRCASLERDQKGFESTVAELYAVLEEDQPEGDTVSVVASLHARMTQAGKDEIARDKITQQIKKSTESMKKLKETSAKAELSLDRLMKAAGVTTLGDLETVERRAAQKRAEIAKLEVVEQRIRELGSDSIEALIEATSGRSADELQAERSTAEAEVGPLDSERTEKTKEVGALRSELDKIDGSGAAAERTQEAVNVLSKVREEADRYAKLQLAVQFIRRAMKSYRDSSQGPVVNRASDLFPKITAGAFSKVRVDANEADETHFLAVRDDNREVRVANLSDGERDQLYLAIRLATLDRYFESNSPMPLLLDDLLINFDDDRAKATFEVLDELASKTQILFFTHHEHLVNLAEAALPKDRLTVHRLPTAG